MNTVEPIRDMDKINEIIEYLKENEGPRNYLLFTLGVNSALRISDLLSLQVNDVVNEDWTIKENIYIREGKTNKEKKYSLSNGAKKAVQYYIDNIYSKKFHGHSNLRQDDYLFASQRGPHDPMNRTWAWSLIQRWTEEVDLSGNYGAHSLRKSWGYHALRSFDAPIEMIQAKLNHSSPAVTRRYIGIQAEEISDLEKKVSFG